MRGPLVDLWRSSPSNQGREGRHMEKESFILQMTRPGRLPTNAIFKDERTARLEAERVQQTGVCEHIKLVRMVGVEKRVVFEFGKPGGGGPKKSMPAGDAQRAGGAKTPVMTEQFVRRLSTRFTFLLIGGVILYAVQFFMRK
jgi:hypothetical protein